jgi:hypothetical protein
VVSPLQVRILATLDVVALVAWTATAVLTHDEILRIFASVLVVSNGAYVLGVIWDGSNTSSEQTDDQLEEGVA